MEAAREARATSESFKALCRLSLGWELERQRNEPPIEYIKRRIRFDFPPGIYNHRDRAG